MEALAVLAVLFVGCSVFIFPIWAFIRIRSQGEEIEALRLRLSHVETDLRNPAARQKAEASATAGPVAQADYKTVVATPSAPTPVAPTTQVAPAAAATPAATVSFSPEPAAHPLPPASSPISTPIPPPGLAQPAGAVPSAASVTPTQSGPVYVAPKKPAPAINWEQFMGVKLFAWLGGFALFLGAVFFVKLSIEQGWIPPEVRVALGFILGAGLVAGGVVLSRKKYAVTAQTLCATGIVTLYAVTFACRSIYHFSFFGVIPTFAVMALITTTAFLLAVRMDARVVALLGMLGGFLTPILLSTGRDNPMGLFGYIGLLNIGLLAVALHRRWHFLVPLAAACTGLMEIGWAARFLDSSKGITAIIVCLAFDFLFLAGFGVARRRRQSSPALAVSVVGLVLLSFGFAWYLGAYNPLGLQAGRWLAFVFLADLCLLAMGLLDTRFARLHCVGGSAVFLLLGAWTYTRLNSDLLEWALASYLIFAVLHSAFPLVLKRLRPGEWANDRSQYAFAPLALILVLGPILNSAHASFAIWPAILLIDIVAIALAWMTASVVGVIAVLVLTLIAAGQSILRTPVGEPGGMLFLVIAGFAVFFFAAGLKLSRRFGAASLPAAEAPIDNLHRHLPALSSLLPFVLLIMAVMRLQLDTPHAVSGLALLLVVLSLGLAVLLRQGLLAMWSLVGSILLIFAWHTERFLPAAAAPSLLWYLLFYAIFTAFPFLFHRHFAPQRSPWIASALAGPLVFPPVISAIQQGWPNDMLGLVPAAFALPALACTWGILRLDPASEPRRLGRIALFGSVTLLFITLIFPIQFERQWITIAWALEGAAVLWLYHRVPHRGLAAAGFALLTVAFVRVSLNPEVLDYAPAAGPRIFNWYLYTYGIVAASLFAGARLLAPPRERIWKLDAPRWLTSFAGVTLFILLNLEIAHYFSPEFEPVRFNASRSFAEGMSYTIGWALFAFGLLVAGIWKRSRAARYAAIALLAVVLIKLFFFDLKQLAQLYRIGALFAVAVVAILASVLYQRFVPPEEKESSDETPPVS
jgi:uncharacterized membrane protein